MGDPAERITVNKLSTKSLWTLRIGSKIKHPTGLSDIKTEFCKAIDIRPIYLPGPVAGVGRNIKTSATSALGCTSTTSAAKQER